MVWFMTTTTAKKKKTTAKKQFAIAKTRPTKTELTKAVSKNIKKYSGLLKILSKR